MGTTPGTPRNATRKHNPYRPFLYGLIALALASYGIYGVSRDDLVFPYADHSANGGLRHSEWLHFHGLYAWLLMLCLCLMALGFVFGILNQTLEQDRRRGRYASLASGTAIAGFFAAGLIVAGAHFFGLGQ